jgi:hypothetical protein
MHMRGQALLGQFGNCHPARSGGLLRVPPERGSRPAAYRRRSARASRREIGPTTNCEARLAAGDKSEQVNYSPDGRGAGVQIPRQQGINE